MSALTGLAMVGAYYRPWNENASKDGWANFLRDGLIVSAISNSIESSAKEAAAEIGYKLNDINARAEMINHQLSSLNQQASLANEQLSLANEKLKKRMYCYYTYRCFDLVDIFY